MAIQAMSTTQTVQVQQINNKENSRQNDSVGNLMEDIFMQTKESRYMRQKEAYQKRMTFFSSRPGLTKALRVTNQILTYTMFFLYPLLLIWLLLFEKESLFAAVVVPLDAFIILSVVRYLVNRKRPYEYFQTTSAVSKATSGKSFPSRHVFSAFVIATTFLAVGPQPVAGYVLLFAGTIIGAIRVLLGVHYVSDVIAGAFFGILAGVAGYLLLI